MYHSCSLPSLYTGAVKSEQKQISISNHQIEFPAGVRLILLKSHFDACLECQVTVLSKLNFKKRACKSMIFKKFVCQLDSNLWPPECKSIALPIELCVLWFSMECCLNFLHFFVFNMQADHQIVIDSNWNTNVSEREICFQATHCPDLISNSARVIPALMVNNLL